jgi:hypothetical protein
MLIFAEGGKPENPEKNLRSKGENQQQTQLPYVAHSDYNINGSPFSHTSQMTK